MYSDGLWPLYFCILYFTAVSKTTGVINLACDLLLAQCIAIFGPAREPATSQVRSLCDSKEIPHVMTGFSESGELPEETQSFSINVFPPPRAIGRALADIVTHYGWKSFVVVYESSDGLIQLQDLLQLSSLPGGPRVTLRQLPGAGKVEKHYTPLLKEIKDRMEQFHIVVHAGLESGRQFLEQAETLRMVGDYYHYLFTNLDLYTLDLETYKQSGCNVTGLRLVDTDSSETTAIIRDLRSQTTSYDRPLLPTVGVQLGKWNSTSGLNVTKNYEKSLSDIIETLENKTLRVTVYLEEPFVMEKKKVHLFEGNDRYEGYCIDLLREISAYRKFNYTITPVNDNSYGAKEADGRWNGMVGELQRGEADLAAASLTITYSRSEVIDFTVPFMHLGISILFKKPEKKDPSLFTFLSPLSLDVWVYMLAAYVGVSLMLWILARFRDKHILRHNSKKNSRRTPLALAKPG